MTVYPVSWPNPRTIPSFLVQLKSISEKNEPENNEILQFLEKCMTPQEEGA